jgi:dTDP-4-dehydrorhamnose 3,5-epimerase
MKLLAQPIAGMVEVQLSFISDARGAFVRTYCEDVFQEAGLVTNWVQMNLSRSIGIGTVRGLHFQRAPQCEAKLIRATEGEVFDVALDLRENSPTYGQVHGVILSAARANAVYIPQGCAHGFQTLSESATLHYCHSHRYAPDLEGGVLATDADLDIHWPLPISQMSDRDRDLPPFREVTPL